MSGNIINTNSLEEARKLIEKANKEGKSVIVAGKSIDFNRIILENKRVSMLILSHKNKKDKYQDPIPQNLIAIKQTSLACDVLVLLNALIIFSSVVVSLFNRTARSLLLNCGKTPSVKK